MGKRGPAAKTAATREKEGSARPDRKTAPPKAPRGAPPRPAGLNRRAVAAWTALCTELAALGLLAKTDGAMLEAASVAISRAREARAKVNRDGILAFGSQGQAVVHPAVKLERELWEQARRLLGELGLSPAARLRMQMPVGGAGARAPEGAEPADSQEDVVTAKIGASPRRLIAVDGGKRK